MNRPSPFPKVLNSHHWGKNRFCINIILVLGFSLVLHLSGLTNLSLAQNIVTETNTHFTQNIYPHFERLGAEAGFTQTRITSLLQDHQGYLWIGTLDGGLVRYDGYTFQSFKHDPDDSSSLSSSGVETLFEDSRGWLWIGTLNGLNLFHPETETFSRFDLQTLVNGPLRVRTICEDSTAAIWFGTLSGLFRIPYPDRLAPIGSSPILAADNFQMQVTGLLMDEGHTESLKNRITRLVVDNQGVIWVGTEGGLGWLTKLPESEASSNSTHMSYTFSSFPEEPGAPNHLPEQYVKNLICDRSGAIWVLMDNFHRIDGSNGLWTVESYTLPGDYFVDSALFEIPNHVPTWFWIGETGLINFDPVSKLFQRIKITEEEGATDVSPSVIIQDEADVI